MASINIELQIDNNIDECDCIFCKSYFDLVNERAAIDGINIELSPLQKRFITMLRFMLEGKLVSMLDIVCDKILEKDYTPLQLNPFDKQYINVTFSGMPKSSDKVSDSDQVRPGQRRFT